MPSEKMAQALVTARNRALVASDFIEDVTRFNKPYQIALAAAEKELLEALEIVRRYLKRESA